MPGQAKNAASVPKRGKAFSGVGRPMIGYKEAATYLAVSETTVRRLCYEGAIPYYKIAGVARIKPEELDRFVAANIVAPGQGE